MVNRPDSNKARQKRHTRVRAKVSGTAECPRLNVFRSLQNIYAQLIDDVKGETLVSASTVEKDFEDYGGNKSAAHKVGEVLAKRAADKGITLGECVLKMGHGVPRHDLLHLYGHLEGCRVMHHPIPVLHLRLHPLDNLGATAGNERHQHYRCDEEIKHNPGGHRPFRFAVFFHTTLPLL